MLSHRGWTKTSVHTLPQVNKRRNDPSVDGARIPAKQAGHRPVPQQVQVIDAVRPADHPSHQARDLQLRVHPARLGDAHVLAGQCRQADPLRQGHHRIRPARDMRFGSSNDA